MRMIKDVRGLVVMSALVFMTANACLADGVLDSLLELKDGRSMRATSTKKLPSGLPDPDSNHDNFRVKPGETHLLGDLKGPGIITHIWMTFLGPEPHSWAKNGSANHKEMVLKIYFDGAEHPQVESPVGDFFASGFGMRMDVKSVPVQVENGASYNCFWPMPFYESARIEIENDGAKDISLLYFNIDWIQKKGLPIYTPLFHAQYRQEYPVQKGKDYLIFEGEGRGHYVGSVLSVRSRSPGWFGEGDEKIYIDEDETASIWGTGSEDYFLCAWGLRKTCYPYFGVPYTDGGHVLGGKTVAYRWHLADPIVFQKKIRVTIEHFGWISIDENPGNKSTSWNERQDDYSSVAFWYQIGKAKKFATVPPCAKRKLPKIDTVFHGKNYLTPEYHGDGEIRVQTGGYWTDYRQLFFKPEDDENAWIEIPFQVEKRQPKRLIVKLTTSYDYGIYDILLDGIKVKKGLDLYSEETVVKEFPLLDFWPAEGEHKIRFVRIGKNPLSKEGFIGVDSLILRERRPRVEEYGWDKDNDWRKKKILY